MPLNEEPQKGGHPLIANKPLAFQYQCKLGTDGVGLQVTQLEAARNPLRFHLCGTRLLPISYSPSLAT